MSKAPFINGYEEKTTFWSDFSIADAFGIKAIKDTFERAFKEWKDNYIYLTELVLVTNYKCRQWYGVYEQLRNINKRKAEAAKMISQQYADYFYQCRAYAQEHLTGDEFEYFFNVTD